MSVDSQSKEDRVTIYYDGLCHLCSREIGHYKKMRGSENIHFVDITDPGFDPQAEGLDPVRINKFLHVRDKFGTLHTGVDAFVQIWNELPTLQPLAAVAKLRPVNALLGVAYHGFALLRPLLPRKACADSPYCDIKQR